MDVLKVTKEHCLYFKSEKCMFHTSRINYLGVFLEGGVTQMDPVKIEGVHNWPTLQPVMDIHAFLGFCIFYHMFIKGFTNITKALTNLTKKDTDW